MNGSQLLLKWDLRIKEVKSNGYLVEEYCRKIGITARQYYYWHKKIKDINTSSKSQAVSETGFSELAFKTENEESIGLSVTFDCGIKVIPEKGFDEVEFIRIAKILRSLQQC